MTTISEELKPILEQLQSEGYEVYTYDSTISPNEVNSLYWFENGRVLNIQPSSWRHERYARDRFNIGVSYRRSRENGSGCGLSNNELGTPAAAFLKYRKTPTWVHGVTNYSGMDAFIKDAKPLNFWKIEKVSA